MTTEIWKSIPGWSEYEASSHGRVRRVLPARGTRAGKVLKPVRNGDYLKVSLSRNAEVRTEWVHRLVALAFHGVPDDPLKEVAHRDNCGTNNVPTNLRWATRASNSADRIDHGTHIQGVANPSAKLNDAAVRAIRTDLTRGTARRALARQFAVSVTTIDDIANNKAWRHVV